MHIINTIYKNPRKGTILFNLNSKRMDVKSRILDQPLAEIYRNMEYRLTIPPLNLQIGQKHPDLDSFLIDNNVYSWAYICQPTSKIFELIQKAKLRYTMGECFSNNLTSTSTAAIFVLDSSVEFAKELALAIRQPYIIYGELNREAEIICCNMD